MKRYRERKTLRFNSRLLSSMEEDANGYWVKYEDCMAAIAYVIHELNPGLTKDDEEQLIKEAQGQ